MGQITVTKQISPKFVYGKRPLAILNGGKMTNTILVSNKAELIVAIGLCSFNHRTVIINKREKGGKTTFKFPAGVKKFPSVYEYSKHLNRIACNVRNIPAHVWQ